MGCCNVYEKNFTSELLIRHLSDDVSYKGVVNNATILSDGVKIIDCTSYNIGDPTKIVQVKLYEKINISGAPLLAKVRMHIYNTYFGYSAGDTPGETAAGSYMGYYDFESVNYFTVADNNIPGNTIGICFGTPAPNFNGYVVTQGTRALYYVLENRSDGSLDLTNVSYYVELYIAK